MLNGNRFRSNGGTCFILVETSGGLMYRMTMKTNQQVHMTICEFITILNAINLLHVSVTFCDHLQAGGLRRIYNKDIETSVLESA